MWLQRSWFTLAAAALLPLALSVTTRPLRAQDQQQPETSAPPPAGAPLMNLPPQFRERLQRAQQGLPVEGQHPRDPSLVPPSRLPSDTAPQPVTPSVPVQAPQPQAVASAPLPTSLLNQPARKASVTLDANGLFIRADNSNLSQILTAISSTSGMKVEGLGRDERIYGNYGPGEPHEVLNSLLYGSGYNILMVGSTTIGAPRQLILTARAGQTVSSAAPQTTSSSEDDDEGTPYQDPDAPQPVQPVVQTPAAAPAAPPANNAPQPSTAQPDTGQSGADGSTPKTAQQLFDQLQKLHQQQSAPAAQPAQPSTAPPQ